MSGGTIRFGVFELDLAARQLRKNGSRIKLQDQPFRVLQLLVERPGEVVTREELKEKLWSDDTFVEFDHSLNTAVQKIRQALGDSATSPRFLETIPRVGYRFLGEVPASTPNTKVSPGSSMEPTSLRSREKLLVGLGVAAAVILALFLLLRPETVDPAFETPRRFAITTESDPFLARISPDGRWIAYRTGGSARTRTATLWIQDLHRDEPRRIAGSGRIVLIGWSPDGSQLAYADNSRLLRLPVEGGQPVLIAALDFPFLESGAWSPDGRSIILAPPAGSSRLVEVDVQSGAGQTVLAADDAEFQGVYREVQYLPGSSGAGKIVYVEIEASRHQLVSFDPESGRRRVIGEGREPFYSPSGHLLYTFRGGLWVMPFSTETLAATGPAIEFRRGGRYPSVAADGTLAYVSRDGGRQELVWKDRRGVEVGTAGQPQDRIRFPFLSPGGDRISVSGREEGLNSVWVHEVARPAKTRITFDSFAERSAWHPSCEWIAYAASGSRFVDIFLISTDGSGAPRLLVSTPYPEFPFSWSSDGRRLLFNRNQALGDLWYVEVDEQGNPVAEKAILATEFDEFSPVLSPDDRFLAYSSDKSGRHEVYVRTFPEGDRDWLVSTNGGGQARWRSDGRELYYVDPEGTLFAVPIALTPEFSPGPPQRLFNHGETLVTRGHNYDVTPDGQRFLMGKVLEESRSVIRVVDNWFAELKELEGGGQ